MPLGLFGSIFSSALGASSQDSANRTNLRINHMNNAFNERMLDKQNQMNIAQFNREKALEQSQWERDTAYNSASAQADRFRQAGLNPTIMMKGQSAGMAQSGSVSGNGVGLPSSSGNATMQPYYPVDLGDAIRKSYELEANLERNKAETNWFDTQSIVARAKAAADIALTREKTRGTKFDNDLNDATQSILASLRNEQFLTSVQNRDFVEKKMQLADQQKVLNRLNIEAIPQRLSMDISVAASQIGLNSFNSKTDVEKLLNLMEKRGYKISDKQKTIIFDALIQDIETQQYRGLNPFNTAIGILNRD